jgi:DNA invertase Pin-like site-specific DNA recombinase
VSAQTIVTADRVELGACKLAVIYARISNDTEGRELGVARQLADCRELAARLGLTVVAEYVENDTGASTRSKKARPQYAAMVELVRAGGAGTVLAYSNSRLSRRPAEWLQMIELAERTGVEIRTVASGDTDFTTADGRAVALTIAAWDAAEAERTSERVRRAFTANAANGQPHGPIAYGWTRVDGVDTIDEAEADVVREAARRILAGETIRGVARDLNAREIPAPRAAAWSSTTLHKLVLRERNAARRVHQGTVVGPAAWQAILDDDTYDAVVAMLADPARRTNKRGASPVALLSGLIVCGLCGDTRVWVVARSNTVGAPRAYQCKSCNRISRKAEPIDVHVADAVCGRLAQPNALDWLAQDADGLAAARAHLAGLQAQEAELADAYAARAPGVTLAFVTRANATLQPAIEAARAAVDRARPLPAAVRALAELGSFEDVVAAWELLSLDAQRAVVAALVTITLQPTTRRRFDASAVQLDWRTELGEKIERRAPAPF